MNFDLKTPCKHCPFRTDVKPFLRFERAVDIAISITDHDRSFPCHKTTRHDDDGEYVPTQKEQHCAGASIMLEKMRMPNQMMRIASRGAYDRNALDMDAPVYENVDAMLRAYREAGN